MTKEMILREFARYVGREMSRKELAKWIVSNIQQVLNSGDDSALQLMDKADVLLMELSSGEISEADFFIQMAAIVESERTISASVSFASGSFVVGYGQLGCASEEVTSQDHSSLTECYPSFG